MTSLERDEANIKLLDTYNSSRDQATRDQALCDLFRLNEGVIHHVCLKYRHLPYHDDLISVAKTAFLIAIRKCTDAKKLSALGHKYARFEVRHYFKTTHVIRPGWKQDVDEYIDTLSLDTPMGETGDETLQDLIAADTPDAGLIQDQQALRPYLIDLAAKQPPVVRNWMLKFLDGKAELRPSRKFGRLLEKLRCDRVLNEFRSGTLLRRTLA